MQIVTVIALVQLQRTQNNTLQLFQTETPLLRY